MTTHPTFYVGLLKPYRPAGAAKPAEPTASQNTAERHSPSSERDLPREAGQAQEPDQEHEPVRGEPLAPPSNPTGRTDHGTRRGASPGSGTPARRSPRLANIGHASGQRHHPAAEADPDAVPQAVQVPSDTLEVLQAGLRILDASAKRHHLRSADHPAVADKTPHRREGPPGQDESQSNDAEASWSDTTAAAGSAALLR
ncbi:hypothetical protein PF003_g25461 [Phytophthora fragariae]|nr:hypothetical protein PF003_g25461 [Phytophthora fragariae]